MMTEVRVQGLDFGASAVFRVVLGTPTTALARQLPRKERWVLLLLDGRRSVSDLAHLTQRSELDVAYALTRFLQHGYIEPVAEHPSQ
jgi:aminopeptidase-like protein